MNALDLVVVRHGRTAWNAAGRYQGRSDVPLDDLGREQAANLASSLAGERFARAVSSDLGRARSTAEIILADLPVPLELDRGWREFDFGAWEGLTWTEIATRFPEAEGRPNRGGRFVTPQGGSESFADLVRRIEVALDALARFAPAKVLVVTHAGPLYALLRLAYGSEARALAARFSPASVSRFVLRAGKLDITSLNAVGTSPGLRQANPRPA